MRVLSFAGNLFGGALVALAVPLVILAVGAPIVLGISLLLTLLGLR
jgi:hypothetical protein